MALRTERVASTMSIIGRRNVLRPDHFALVHQAGQIAELAGFEYAQHADDGANHCDDQKPGNAAWCPLSYRLRAFMSSPVVVWVWLCCGWSWAQALGVNVKTSPLPLRDHSRRWAAQPLRRIIGVVALG